MKGFNQKVRLTIIQALKAAKIEFMRRPGGKTDLNGLATRLTEQLLSEEY